MIRVERAEQQANDLRTNLFKAVDKDKFEEKAAQRKEALPKELEAFEKFLGNRQFVVGSYLTYADLLWYDALDFHRLFAPEAFANTKIINDYLARIENYPGIKEYMASDLHKTRMLFGPQAAWGGMKSE